MLTEFENMLSAAGMAITKAEEILSILKQKSAGEDLISKAEVELKQARQKAQNLKQEQWAIILNVGGETTIEGDDGSVMSLVKLSERRPIAEGNKNCPVCKTRRLVAWAGWYTCDFSYDHCIGLVQSGVMFKVLSSSNTNS